MKKIVPFSKDLMFKTKIGEITAISLDHTLKLDNNIVSGEFIIDGNYKMIESSEIEEKFNYKIPVDIAIDGKYDTKNCVISVDEFTYEIINEEMLRVNISVMLDDLDIKKDLDKEIETIEIESLERDETDKKDEKLETTKELDDKSNTKIVNDSIVNDIDVNINSNVKVNNKELEKELFDNLSDEHEYSIYRVYTVKEDDTVDLILEKFNISRDMLSLYNDLDNLVVGSKLIIPSIDE